jgi:hypothetical protein
MFGGSASVAGVLSCTLCPVGTFNDQLMQAKCTSCAIGSFNSAVGQTACARCPTDTTTNSVGSTLPSACVSSMCQSSAPLITNASLACRLPLSLLASGVGLPSNCSTGCSLPFLAYYDKCWPATSQPPFALTQYATTCLSNRPPTVPDQVVGVVVQAIADATVSLSWLAPNSNRAPINSYTVSYVIGTGWFGSKIGTPMPLCDCNCHRCCVHVSVCM